LPRESWPWVFSAHGKGSGDGSENHVPATLPIQITRKAKWFLATCSALDVASQGEMEEEAKKNIAEALFMFFRSCYERGTRDAVLKQCGLYA
jgi:predicted RNase H-like HicB family nuclease